MGWVSSDLERMVKPGVVRTGAGLHGPIIERCVIQSLQVPRPLQALRLARIQPTIDEHQELDPPPGVGGSAVIHCSHADAMWSGSPHIIVAAVPVSPIRWRIQWVISPHHAALPTCSPVGMACTHCWQPCSTDAACASAALGRGPGLVSMMV